MNKMKTEVRDKEAKKYKYRICKKRKVDKKWGICERCDNEIPFGIGARVK